MAATLTDAQGATFKIQLLNAICKNSRELYQVHHVNHDMLTAWVFCDPVVRVLQDWKRELIDQKQIYDDLRHLLGKTQQDWVLLMKNIAAFTAQRHTLEPEAFVAEFEAKIGMQHAEGRMAYTAFLLARDSVVPGKHRLEQHEEMLRLYKTTTALILDVLQDLHSSQSYWESKLGGKSVKKQKDAEDDSPKAAEGLDMPKATAHQKRTLQPHCEYGRSSSKRQRSDSIGLEEAVAGPSTSAIAKKSEQSKAISPPQSPLFVPASPERGRATQKNLDHQGPSSRRSMGPGPFIEDDSDDECPPDDTLEDSFSSRESHKASWSSQKKLTNTLQPGAIQPSRVPVFSSGPTQSLKRHETASDIFRPKSNAEVSLSQKPSGQKAHSAPEGAPSSSSPVTTLKLGRSLLTSKKTTFKSAQASEQSRELVSLKEENHNQNKEIARLRGESALHKEKLSEFQNVLAECKQAITALQEAAFERDKKIAHLEAETKDRRLSAAAKPCVK